MPSCRGLLVFTGTSLGAINSYIIAAVKLVSADKAEGGSAWPHRAVAAVPVAPGTVPWVVAPSVPLTPARFAVSAQRSEIL